MEVTALLLNNWLDKHFSILWLGLENSCTVVYLLKHGDMAPVVWKQDNAVHRINLYPEDSAISFPNIYLVDSDLSTRGRLLEAWLALTVG